ncbi:transcription factor IIA, alpha/beta subunit [Pseudoneurospora amorphoporcata]|uniref:Transcription initiation factor IIA large subunit n=1 Tax=Pseudoneurospora amorphoporcata TaxID=241081 RepID=A0AAN6SHN8_9PEZI|nr:transcription factor IIA, alpha/beta subunit [Pseudoneurospora amorphoporcata]
MSNNTVGTVYEHIINEVINAVRVDFEENGVDDSVLEELKKGWQHKLSQLNVAQFPWDPKPEAPPPAQAQQNTSAAANAQAAAAQQQQTANYTQSTLSPQTAARPLSMPGGQPNGNGVAIKNEPGLVNEPAIKQEPGTMQPMMHPAYPGNNAARGGMAAQRAAQAIASRYGSQAQASINAIHQQTQQPQNPGQAPQQQQQLTPQQQYQQNVAAQMQQQRMAQQPGQQQQPSNQQNGLGGAQVDGPSDGFDGVLMRRDADGNPVEMGRVEIDNLLHAKLLERAKEREGGGLMLPLKEATKSRGIASNKRSRAAARGAGANQLDGNDEDDDEFDEDAINSDLDDPEDERDDDDEEDEASGWIMLCLYDKVQRVKNKWKCTLKDGVLTVNGKEYVFHKANGEYEW